MEVVELLAVAHEEIQKGLEENVDMQVAHNKTIVLASNQVFADKIAQRIGVPSGVTVCKKLGVDYRLFGSQSDQSRPQSGPKRKVKGCSARCKRIRRPGLKTMAAKKVKFGCFATRSARIDKAAKKAARAGMLKHGRGRMFVAGVLPVAICGAEHEPWDEGDILALERGRKSHAT